MYFQITGKKKKEVNVVTQILYSHWGDAFFTVDLPGLYFTYITQNPFSCVLKDLSKRLFAHKQQNWSKHLLHI